MTAVPDPWVGQPGVPTPRPVTAPTPPPDLGTAWCPECHRTRPVADRFTASRMERWGEVETNVTALDCGHSTTHGDHVVGAAPGAPYVGPGVPVAATTRGRDLTAARIAQARLNARLDGDPS